MSESVYNQYYHILFPIAYNMLGSVSDAEDLVQETLLKWLTMNNAEVENVRGYLVKTLVNKCLNHIRDRKKEVRHPEIAPELLADFLPGIIDKSQTLSLGVKAMLEKLSPVERAVFLLKEIFGYAHREIAEMLEITEEYCRQILTRARRHLRENRARYEVNPEHHLLVYQTFVEVCKGENLSELLQILREDIQLDVSQPAAVFSGRMQVAEYLLGQHRMGLQYEILWLKDLPAIVAYLYHQPVRVIRLEGNGEEITSIQIEVLTRQAATQRTTWP
ncbi:MAG: sigma-70 family RNA polymerase sigma factor [Bacteroidia bacterium]|nr:sigma-70 family RNA polymerase sigma factor [Bacteroidia bacterium]